MRILSCVFLLNLVAFLFLSLARPILSPVIPCKSSRDATYADEKLCCTIERIREARSFPSQFFCRSGHTGSRIFPLWKKSALFHRLSCGEMSRTNDLYPDMCFFGLRSRRTPLQEDFCRQLLLHTTQAGRSRTKTSERKTTSI